jgi:integrase
VANPVARAQVPRQTREPAGTLAGNDVERILATTAGTTDAALWAVLALAGLRLGEGLGLAEGDVDLHSRTVRVRRTLLHDRSLGPPKSVRSEREVPMPDRLVELLRRHRALVAEQRLAGSQWVETDALFRTRRGNYPLIATSSDASGDWRSDSTSRRARRRTRYATPGPRRCSRPECRSSS